MLFFFVRVGVIVSIIVKIGRVIKCLKDFKINIL